MTREELLASLTATHTPSSDSIETSGGYIDWGTYDDNARTTAFEISADGDTAVLWMTRDELAELHRKLTITLLVGQA